MMATQSEQLHSPTEARASACSPQFLSSAEWLEGGLAILDGTGRVVSVNEPLGRWLGLSPAELTGRDFWVVLEGRCPEWAEPVGSWRRGSDRIGRLQLTLKSVEHPAGGWFQVELARHDGAMFVRIASTLPPSTELAESGWDEHLRWEAARWEMFKRLSRAEAQLAKMGQHWPGIIFSQRPDFSFDYVTPRIEELTGVPVSEWQSLPQRFWQVIHEAEAEALQQEYKRAVRSGEPVTTTLRLRHVVSGKVSYVLEHRQPLLGRGGLLLGYEGVWLDVTRQTIAEKRLAAAAWKETLAVLTMGLAHDFGNIMAGIHSLSESFIEQTQAGHPFAEGLGLIKKNSMQASQLVHRIINLHLGKTGERNYHDLNDLVADIVDLVRKIISRRIQVTADLAKEPLPVYLDAVEFRQAAINLALNAAEAMPQSGRLTFRTSRHETWPEPTHAHGGKPRLPCVRLSVEDTGCGIKSRHLDSVFDAFFTTKSVNKGSGLGLYNARLFVEKHSGVISVDSTEGKGARFDLWLPQADFSEGEREHRTYDTESIRRRSILVVGDSGRLLEETAEWLRTHAYHVVSAFSSEAADEMLRSGDYSFAAVFLLLEAGDATPARMIPHWRRHQDGLKVILKLIGRDLDDWPTDILNNADFVMTPETSEPGLLQDLKQMLSARK